MSAQVNATTGNTNILSKIAKFFSLFDQSKRERNAADSSIDNSI